MIIGIRSKSLWPAVKATIIKAVADSLHPIWNASSKGYLNNLQTGKNVNLSKAFTL